MEKMTLREIADAVRGQLRHTDGTALIDEISAGNMRVYKNGKKLDYISLSNLII